MQRSRERVDVVASLLSMIAAVVCNIVRRNPCTLVLLLLLVPWAYFLWQINSHFGQLIVSPFQPWRSRSLPPVQVPATPAPVLLVTALFPSHISNSDKKWLSNFLGRVTTDIYLYAPPELEHVVRGMRGDLSLLLNTSFGSPSDIPVVASFTTEEYTLPEVEALRLTKPWLVSAALDHVSRISDGREKYRYAFWLDADALQEPHAFSDWPNTARIDAVLSSAGNTRTANDLVFVPLTRRLPAPLRMWNRSRGPVSLHSGWEPNDEPFFGGGVEGVHWFTRAFYDLLEEYMREGHHIHKQADITNALILLHPERFVTFWNDDLASPSTTSGLGECGSPWYYFLWWLAAEAERDEMNVLWSSAKWRWDFWREASMCYMARASPVLEMLRQSFGPDWTPPPESHNAHDRE